MIASQETASPPAGFTHYARQTMVAADASLADNQFSHWYSTLEGYNAARLGWGTPNAIPLTLSFWVRTSIPGSWGGSFRSAGSAMSYVWTYTTATTGWEYKTITIPGPTTGTWGKVNDAWGSLVFCQGFATTCIYRTTTANAWLSGGTSGGNYIGHSSQTNMLGTVGATFDITGVQFEAGSVATPFEHKPYDQELREAQRFYERRDCSVNVGQDIMAVCYATGAVAVGTWQYMVPKRAQPIILFPSNGSARYVGTAGSVTGQTMQNSNRSIYAATLATTATQTAGAGWLDGFIVVADAEM